MTSWTDHVRDKAKEYGLSYTAAMSDARVKGSYTKASRKPLTDEQKKSRRAARLVKIGNNALSLNPVPPTPRKRKVVEPTEPPKTAKERRAMATKRAMELTQNKPVDYVPKARKPMSEETKAMLKARREAKKADVAKKFESFWERHEGLPAGGPLAGSGVRTASLATIAKEAASAAVAGVLRSAPQPVVVAPKKKRAKPGQGKGRGVQKMSEETKALLKARRQGSKMRPPKQPTTFTALSADEMAFHANLLG